jgi:hypothetical protein
VSVVRVELDPPYDVVIEPGALAQAGDRLRDRRRVAVVSQEPIASRYADRLLAGIDAPTEVFLL